MAAARREENEFLGVLDREELQDELVNQAEDRRVRADAERERENSHAREERRLAQGAESESKILPEGGHDRYTSLAGIGYARVIG